jgi:3,4-dihydroxy 2-butanone 4-phosphate synthase/GTP cyclohydrolase II
MIVVVDDEDRENEGDLTLAAEKVTPEAINFMAKFGRGLVCLAMTEERLDHLRIGPMTSENTSQYGTAFCEAIDARDGVTTGISAYDRARTIQGRDRSRDAPVRSGAPRPHVSAARPQRRSAGARRTDRSFRRSGAPRRHGSRGHHLRNHERRRHHGARARSDRVLPHHEMKMLTVAELIRYRMQHERYVHRVGEAMVETKHGEFRLIAYESEVDGGGSHMALIRGDISDSSKPVLVRMHAHCLLGDVFGATGCDCHQTLEASLKIIAEEDRGALIYLHQTSKGFTAEKIGDQSFLTFHRERACRRFRKASARLIARSAWEPRSSRT